MGTIDAILRFIGLRPSEGRSAAAHFAVETNWVWVNSTNVLSISYYYDLSAPARSVLGMRTRKGREYRYFDVPIAAWLDMQVASSKGRFVHQQLNRYRFRRVK